MRSRRRTVSGKMRHAIIVLLMAAAFCSGFFSHTLLSAHAEEKSTRTLNRYYTSIRLKNGDNLWDIARTYAEGSGYTVSEYVEELKRMNGLSGEEIHSGKYLTVMYFAE